MQLANFFGGSRFPSSEFGNLDEMRRLLPNVLPTLSMTETQGRRRNWLPDLDIGEDDEAYHVWADLPGVNIDELRLDLKGNALVIKGKRKYGPDFKEQLLLRERGMGKIYRVIPLFEDCDANHIAATYESGVLHVTIKKLVQQHQTTRIHVESKQRTPVHQQVSREVPQTIPGKDIKLPADTHIRINKQEEEKVQVKSEEQRSNITPGMETTGPIEHRGTEEFEKGKASEAGKELGKEFEKGKVLDTDQSKSSGKGKKLDKEGEKFKDQMEAETERQTAVGSAGR